jgi:two-component system LytT family sensor kinase
MPETFQVPGHLLINTLGHAAGVVVFGIFLFLLMRRPLAGSRRADRLSRLAAVLAFLWNLASLVVLATGGGGPIRDRALAAFGFSVLSMLPAVLLDLCLPDRLRAIVRLGYAVSALAVAAHVAEPLLGSDLLHGLGIDAITWGFGALTVAAVAAVVRTPGEDRRRLSSRILTTMSLFLFAVSFLHFGERQGHQAWSAELAIHHAGIPLALFVLMQDYRFVLLDAFMRFLVNVLMAGMFSVLLVAALRPELPVGWRLLAAAAALAGFTLARGGLQRLLTRLVFRRPDADEAARRLRALGSQSSGEVEYLERASREIAGLMGARLVEAPAALARDLTLPALATTLAAAGELERLGVEVVVPVRLPHRETHAILLGTRRGGRRYLSEDLDALARLAACVAEQVDHIREAEMRRLVSQAEMRALQSQIHPHFLFNALNALYGVIPREAASARRTVLNLADILRYFLQTERAFIPLEEEICIVRAYLAIEELRLGDKLTAVIDVDPDAMKENIPVLTVQPLVENAVKHGISQRQRGGTVSVEIRRRDGGLHVRVRDSGPGFGGDSDLSGRHTGVGLENVARRLQLCFGPEAKLEIASGAQGAEVGFVVPLAVAAGPA